MFGYTGKNLKIDLTTKSFEIFDTDEVLCKRYLGGRGFGVSIISDRITKDPFSEEIPIIFATGPLLATPSVTSGRMSVISRSPLTNTVFDSSVGGRFGTSLKKAGFDYLEIVGMSDKWVGIVIDGGLVRIEDGTWASGLNTKQVFEHFKDKYSTAVIGIAGENLVRFASIVFDNGHYHAGRGGLGAVMGYKRLKYIAVRGDNPIQIHHPDSLKTAVKDVMRLLRASPAIYGEFGLHRYGTACLVDVIHAKRLEPTENFKKTFFEHSSRYSAYAINHNYKSISSGCNGCPILCKKTGKDEMPIPEYETLSHFGALNCNYSLEIITEANRLCNLYGLDTISTASTIACYKEISGQVFEPKGILQLIHDIAHRNGNLGFILGEGSLRYADSVGMRHLSMSVKGLELPAYDPRGSYGMALGYAVSNRGGCHLRAYPISHEILRKPVATDRFSFEGKARIIKIAEDTNAIIDSLTACKFIFFAVSLEEFANILNAVTGLTHNVQSLLEIGDRICRLERVLNNKNGFTSKDDDLPQRFFEEEGSSSKNVKIRPINRQDFLDARGRYYTLRGADKQGRIIIADEKAH
ncbi:MAG: aldehyde ferredoxin oxidoreductase family protein [Thermodesulfovibrionales bacterium]|nr:aldehyde ferredoxin oxidoreductase family protein [Thermodesulfovibrionales bacterium]